MGFDIEVHIETQINGEWNYYGKVPIRRNYKLFALLGFIDKTPCEWERMFPPKAVPTPKDITVTTSLWYLIQSASSFGNDWLNSREVAQFVKFLRENWDTFMPAPAGNELFGWFFGGSFENFNDPKFHGVWDKARQHGLQDFRMLYWFH